jgi:hypothetical protein
MSNTNNGGPAFPPMHDPDTHASGMTLRDYFAAQVAGSAYDSSLKPPYSFDAQAKYAYMLADAMLKAREAE